MSKNNDEKKLNISQLDKKIQQTKSIDEKNRLKKYRQEKAKDNVKTYSGDIEDMYETSQEYLAKIRRSPAPGTTVTKSGPSSGVKPKPPSPDFRPKI